MTSPALRARYLTDSVTTATPGQLLVMLYDRLVLDMVRGEEALRAGNRLTASEHVIHAQEILMELRVTLDTSSWSGATGLAQLYAFLITELIAANIRGEADRVGSCRTLVEPLRDAWREAAMAQPEPATPAEAAVARVA